VGDRYTIEDIYAGTCFLLPKPRSEIKHLWIVLTDPDNDIERNMVIVNLTTLKKGVDKTVVLKFGDHRFIKHDTAVFYEDARIASCVKVIQYLNYNYPVYKLHDNCSDLILKKIQQGIFDPNVVVREEVQKYCRLRLNR
jgi:predicted nucleotide-binding protein (sugar kinase/HSP70/actin superfamily)